MTTINEIIDQLEAGPVTFRFTKLNGDVREMKATRAVSIIGSPIIDKNDVVVTVWDIATNGYRSIRKTTEIEVL